MKYFTECCYWCELLKRPEIVLILYYQSCFLKLNNIILERAIILGDQNKIHAIMVSMKRDFIGWYLASILQNFTGDAHCYGGQKLCRLFWYYPSCFLVIFEVWTEFGGGRFIELGSLVWTFSIQWCDCDGLDRRIVARV